MHYSNIILLILMIDDLNKRQHNSDDGCLSILQNRRLCKSKLPYRQHICSNKQPISVFPTSDSSHAYPTRIIRRKRKD